MYVREMKIFSKARSFCTNKCSHSIKYCNIVVFISLLMYAKNESFTDV